VAQSPRIAVRRVGDPRADALLDLTAFDGSRMPSVAQGSQSIAKPPDAALWQLPAPIR
jgi:hypothetical protein